MPMWRCPHCGTPQAEAARCWVCRRSSTACGTCRHFRRSVAARLGFCGLDRRRQPLIGDEIRACWEGWAAGASPAGAVPTIGPAAAPPDHPGRRAFVEVDALPAGDADTSTVAGPPIIPLEARGEPSWDLWGDQDL